MLPFAFRRVGVISIEFQSLPGREARGCARLPYLKIPSLLPENRGKAPFPLALVEEKMSLEVSSQFPRGTALPNESLTDQKEASLILLYPLRLTLEWDPV